MTQPYRPFVPRLQAPALKRILVATDFDAASGEAVDMGAALALDARASLHLLCVLEALMYAPRDIGSLAERDPDLHPEATRQMTAAVARLQGLGIEAVTGGFEFGIAADVIARYASATRFDLLVLGRRGKGSVASHVIPRADIPVMVMPHRPR